jgi:hypothetical protein
VRLRRRRRGTHFGGPPLGLLQLLLSGLGGGEVLGHGLQDLLRVVAQGERRQARRGREQSGGELLPIRQDGLHVMPDELRQTHISPFTLTRKAAPHGSAARGAAAPANCGSPMAAPAGGRAIAVRLGVTRIDFEATAACQTRPFEAFARFRWRLPAPRVVWGAPRGSSLLAPPGRPPELGASARSCGPARAVARRRNGLRNSLSATRALQVVRMADCHAVRF